MEGMGGRKGDKMRLYDDDDGIPKLLYITRLGWEKGVSWAHDAFQVYYIPA